MIEFVRSRSHALRTLWGINGNTVKARCAANHDRRLAYTGRSASYAAFPRNAWERGDQNVGRNKSARRQQGRMFPAIGAPETPVLRLTRGQAYSGLRREVYNDKRSAWERGDQRHQRSIFSCRAVTFQALSIPSGAAS